MKVREKRFAVGSPGNQLSPIWKIWNQKNDVYLTGKFLGGYLKFSLHQSGVWTAAAPKESKIELAPGNRRLSSWKRPEEFSKGLTWGPYIAVPNTGATNDVIIDEKQAKAIEWIPSTPSKTKITLAVVFADSSLSPKRASEIIGENIGFSEDYLELENEQKVFIVALYDYLSTEDQALIENLESEAKKFTDLNNEIKGFLCQFMTGAVVPYVYLLKFGNWKGRP